MTPPLAQLVGDLYGTLLDDEPAIAALDVLCSAIGAAHAVVMRTGPDVGDLLATSHHLAPTQLGRIDQSEEYRQLLASAASGSVVRMTDMVPRREIMRSELYQSTLRVLDGGLALYGLQVDGAGLVVTAICRSAALDADFDDDGVALLRAALPHLIAVTGIAGRMERERRSGQRVRDALDIVDDGVILMNADGRVLHVNVAADAMLACGDRVRRSRAGIVATDRADDLKLQRAIHAVGTCDRGSDGRERMLVAAGPCQLVVGRRTPGWPLIATVMPAERTVGSFQAGAIVVHLRDPATASCLSMASLGTELGLTPREATLVRELARGATLIQAAGQMEVTVGTARQYLKTIFLKTGVGGQAQLLRLVCR